VNPKARKVCMLHTGQLRSAEKVKSAMELPVKREACRSVLEGAGRIWCDDGTGTAMVEEMNRRLGCLWKSEWREVGLQAALKENLGELHPLFRWVWEWQSRVRGGVRSGVAFREARVCPVEDWRALDVREGCVISSPGIFGVQVCSGSGVGWDGGG
jgi:hypothetical protein